MNLEKINKILIIRFSSLGDVLLTTPMLRSLKLNYPNLEIHYLVKNAYADVLSGNNYVAKVYVFKKDNKLKTLANELKKENYDYIIDLHKNLRSTYLLIKLLKPFSRFKKYTFRKFLLVKCKINLLSNLPQIPERYANTVKPGLLDDKGVELYFSNQVENNNGKTIGFAPGSRHFTKQWPEEYFIKLGQNLNDKGYRIALFGGSDDFDICKSIENNLHDCINYSNNNVLEDTFNNIKKCTLIVCNDSGIMHIASATNIPLIAIYGSTVKDFGFTPYKCKNLILENNFINCRPCSHIGREKCPLGHFKCMKEITPDIVLERIKGFIDK